MRICFTRQAIENLEDIAEYLAARNPEAAKRVRAAILESITILKRYPEAGRAQSTEGVRKLIARRYPYLIYYLVDRIVGDIVVLSIKHPAQEPEHENS